MTNHLPTSTCLRKYCMTPRQKNHQMAAVSWSSLKKSLAFCLDISSYLDLTEDRCIKYVIQRWKAITVHFYSIFCTSVLTLKVSMMSVATLISSRYDTKLKGVFFFLFLGVCIVDFIIHLYTIMGIHEKCIENWWKNVKFWRGPRQTNKTPEILILESAKKR